METDPIDIRQLPGTTSGCMIRDQGYFPVMVALDDRELLVVQRRPAGHGVLLGRHPGAAPQHQRSNQCFLPGGML